jgi:hypothetical protein
MQTEVHVGDVGTKYRVRTRDKGVDFDPSDAATKQIIFTMPGGITLVKDALVEIGLEADGELGQFFLVYIVVAAAGAGNPAAEFHAAPGVIEIQGYLAWADGQRYHSSRTNRDADGRKLLIEPNLGERT